MLSHIYLNHKTLEEWSINYDTSIILDFTNNITKNVIKYNKNGNYPHIIDNYYDFLKGLI